MAKQHSNLTIHSFEPHKDTFKRLKENVNLNNFANKIYLYDCALSCKNGDSFLETKNRFKISINIEFIITFFINPIYIVLKTIYNTV